MSDQRVQLSWIQKNRGPRTDRTRAASTLVLEFARELGKRHSGVLQPLAEAVAKIVDRPFREHCRIAVFEGGVLRFSVSDAAMVSIMRMKWAEKLRNAFAGRGRASHVKVRDVRFEFGEAGIAIPPPQNKE